MINIPKLNKNSNRFEFIMYKYGIISIIIQKSYLILISLFLFIFFFLSISNISANKNKKNKIWKILIDSGHGGKDSGALGKKSCEKDITLAIALKLGNYLEQAFSDVEVIYTRKTDIFVELHKRAEIANNNQADLFISIHVNANRSKKVTGTETFAMGLHKTSENLEVAMRENSVILLEDDYMIKYEGYDPNSAESFIIFSLLQNTFLDQSLNFASFVQDQFRERTQRIDRGVKQASFLVLWNTSMPSVLIETGFITNANEEKFLLSDLGQDYIASAIFRAFRGYKNSIDSKSVFDRYDDQVDTIQKNNFNTVVQNPDLVINENNKTDKTNEEVEKGQSTNNDIRFKVQITSSSKPIPLDSEFFKGLKDVEEFEISNTFKYAVGNKTSFQEIVEYRKKIKVYFSDAFIIALKNGKIIPVQEALNEINKQFKERF